METESFRINRKKLFELMPDNSVALFFAAVPKIRNGDTEYPYSQNRSFYYLTGFKFKGAVLLMYKKSGERKELLFIESTNAEQAHWFGALPSIEEARTISGIEKCLKRSEFQPLLHRVLRGAEHLVMDVTLEPCELGFLNHEQQYARHLLDQYPYLNTINALQLMTDLRVIKSEWEIDQIRTAVNLTHEGLISMMRHCKPDMMEYEILAYFGFELHRRNTTFAFQPIIASGSNATVLHYSLNDSRMNDGDLLLADVGAEFGLYSADISRTFPVNGRFSPLQKELYSIVLHANEQVIESVRPGLPLDELNQISRKTLGEGLLRMKIIENQEEISKYFTHGVSHQLGLDTHDVFPSTAVVLKEGMVITIEPGLYLPQLKTGIRIEDDVLVTATGFKNLSQAIPKHPDEIESIMSENSA